MAKQTSKTKRGMSKRRRKEVYIALGIFAALVVLFMVLAQLG